MKKILFVLTAFMLASILSALSTIVFVSNCPK